MPEWMHIVGPLIGTYFVSRVVLWLLRGRRNANERTVAAHVMSLVVLGLVAGLLDSSFFSWTRYLPWQILWFAVDMLRARSQSASAPRRSRSSSSKSSSGGSSLTRSSSRKSSATSDVIVGRTIAVVVGLMTIAYGAFGVLLYPWQVGSYAEVPVGSAPADVLYVLGKPAFVKDGAGQWKRTDDPRPATDWQYTAPFIHVSFNAANAVETLSCREDHPLGEGSCPQTLGVRVGDQEWVMEKMLGPATGVRFTSNGRKLVNYEDAGHEFTLEQFRVKAIRVYPSRVNPFRKILRFIVWMIP